MLMLQFFSYLGVFLLNRRAAAFRDLVMDVLIRRSGDKLFFIMTFCPLRHGIAGSSVNGMRMLRFLH